MLVYYIWILFENKYFPFPIGYGIFRIFVCGHAIILKLIKKIIIFNMYYNI